MAAFVPNNLDGSGVNEPSFIGASKGSDADRSSGLMYSGLGDVTKMAVDATDALYKNRITDEATASIDAERDKLISGRLPDAPTPNGKVPPEVKNQLDRLAQAKEAARAGLMNDSYRDILYDKVARDLRYKYAGYREHIDATIQRLTGINPANRLLEDLRAEASKGASSDEKLYETYVKDAIHQGINVPKLVQDNGGKQLPLPYLQSLIANSYAERATRERLTSEQSLANAKQSYVAGESNLREKDRKEAADLGAVRVREALDQNDIADRSTALRGLGLTPEALKKTAEDYQVNPSLFSPQQEEKLRLSVGKYLADAEVKDRSFLTSPGRDGKSLQTLYGFSKQQVDDLIAQKRSDREAFFQPLLNKDFGAFSSRVRTLEAQKLDGDHRMLANANLAAMASIKRNFGDLVLNSMMTDKPGQLSNTMKDIERVVAETNAAQLVNGNYRSLAHADAQVRNNNSAKATGVNAAVVNDQVLNSLVAVALDPQTNRVAKANAMEALFHGDNVGFITKIAVKKPDGSIDPDKSRAKQLEIYNRLNSEEVRRAVKEASNFNSSVVQNYVSFTTNTGIAIGKQSLDTVKANLIDRDAYAKITFNPETLQFSAQERELSPEGKKAQEAVSPGGVGQMKQIDLQRARRSADELNGIVRKIKPALDLLGSKDVAGELRLRFNQLGFNIDALEYKSNSTKLQGSLRSNLGLGEVEQLQQDLPDTSKEPVRERGGSENPVERFATPRLLTTLDQVDSWIGTLKELQDVEKAYKANPSPELKQQIELLYGDLDSIMKQNKAKALGLTGEPTPAKRK